MQFCLTSAFDPSVLATIMTPDSQLPALNVKRDISSGAVISSGLWSIEMIRSHCDDKILRMHSPCLGAMRSSQQVSDAPSHVWID